MSNVFEKLSLPNELDLIRSGNLIVPSTNYFKGFEAATYAGCYPPPFLIPLTFSFPESTSMYA